MAAVAAAKVAEVREITRCRERLWSTVHDNMGNWSPLNIRAESKTQKLDKLKRASRLFTASQPRCQNSFWNLDLTVRLLRNWPNAVYRKGYLFHKTKVKAFYRKEPQLYETKVDLTSRHTTELKKTTVKSNVILTFLQIWTNLVYIRTGNFNGKMTKK